MRPARGVGRTAALQLSVRQRGFGQRDLPPGPPESPGEQSLRLLREPEEFLADCGRRYGDVFTVLLSFFPPIVFVSHPDTIEQVFRMDRHHDRFRAGEGNSVQLSPLGPSSILALDGDRHARMRRLLGDLWHREYADVVRRASEATVDGWKRGARISLRLEMERIALDVILRAILGLAEGTRRDRMRELMAEWLSAAEDVPKFLTSFAGLMQKFDAEIYREMAEHRRDRACKKDILSRLIDARDCKTGSRLSDAEIRDQLTTLVAAGHDTTASILAWTLFHLFTEPVVLARLRRELAADVGCAPIDDKILRDPLKLRYLTAVLKETMRLHPVVSGVHRKLHRDTLVGRHLLPKGVIVAPCIYLAHRRPELWRDPDRFCPERFLIGKPRKGAYFPFGGGIRGCLGEGFAVHEMKIVVHEVLRRARLRIEAGYRPRATRRGVTHVPDRGIPAVVIDS